MIDFKGFGENVLTLKTAASSIKGKPISISANDTAAVSSSGDLFIGIGCGVRDGIATVQTGGYAELKYSGQTAPSLGYNLVAADANGGVTVSAAGRPITVLHKDTTNSVIGFIF